MTNCPPLPDSMTLPEAAKAMTKLTGTEWTERHILGRAVHHEIQINARIGHAVRLVRRLPIEGKENDIFGPKGCLPPLNSKAVRALLNAGEAEFEGWEHPKTIDFFGAPADVWAMEWELAPGEVAPVVRFENCRVSAAGVIQLASKYTAPAQNTATPAPVVLAEAGTVRETRLAVDAPKFSMSKAALIDAHKHEWLTIERDIADASTNGLAAAKAGARAWWEGQAMEWAKAKGKLEGAAKPAAVLAQTMHSMASIPGRRHTLEG